MIPWFHVCLSRDFSNIKQGRLILGEKKPLPSYTELSLCFHVGGGENMCIKMYIKIDGDSVRPYSKLRGLRAAIVAIRRSPEMDSGLECRCGQGSGCLP